jgi:hypothetical protein
VISRLGLYGIVAVAAWIVLLGARQWLRQRKADVQWATAVAARQRAARNRLAEIDALERMYAAESAHKEGERP